MEDSRAKAARYYDLQPNNPDDLQFYRERLPGSQASVLELGCGTGRVLVPLAGSCRYIHGVDSSSAMLDVCREKLRDLGIGTYRAVIELGDITDFHVGRVFDLVIMPFRVFQNLETDQQVKGLFRCVREHLAEDGTCILTAFNPNSDRKALLESWQSQNEVFDWEVGLDGGRLIRHHRTSRIDAANLIVYPELVYRLYEGDKMVDETILPIAMRCYYPDDLLGTVEDAGFTVVNGWGGYAGEEFGEGPELIVQFKA